MPLATSRLSRLAFSATSAAANSAAAGSSPSEGSNGGAETTQTPPQVPPPTDAVIERPAFEIKDGIVEEYSRLALTREGRQTQIEAVNWAEDTSYPPILAQKRRNVYDYTDDIPAHVKPLYHHQLEQQREYFRARRDTRTWWQKLLTWALRFGGATILAGVIAFTRIWLVQPKEIAELRVKLLNHGHGRVLELAAGAGLNIGSYPYAVSEIVMVDTDAASLQRIRYRIPKASYPKYELYQERAEHLASFKDGEFDCVVDMFGLCHYKDPVMALRQMQRVVKPTGTILLLEHGRSSWYPVNWFLDYFADKHSVNSHGCSWNLPVLDYVKEARLDVREQESLHYGTTHFLVTHPELLDEAAMQRVNTKHIAVR